MGKPHPDVSGRTLLAPQGATVRKISLVPKGVGAELQTARRPQSGWALATLITSIVLVMLLAVAMLPAAGLQAAHADEPAPTRPATTGGDMALEGVAAAGGGSVATDTGMGDVEPDTPVAEEREGGMLAADGLLYTVADGGLSLAGFDGGAPAGALAVPEVVSVDGRAVPIVAIAMGAGQVAEGVTALSLPRSVSEVSLPSLAPAFPALASVEVAPAAGPSLPAAAGAAALRSAYSSSGGMLFAPASVGVLRDGGAVELIECRELVWAPPALVSARIPVDCRSVAAGAFADVRDLQAVVCFGTMERIADGAFAEEQMATAKVVIPAASPAVAAVAEERVSANMALMSDAGQKERRYAWHEAGWRMGDIVMGKPYGSLTETVAVTEEGAVASGEAQLISYPDMHPEATDVKHPDETGKIDMADNGLAFTVKSDMTASVAWRGDPTATPAHVDIPASVVIDGVTYPVTEVAPNAFKGAVFLTDVTVPEGVAVIGEGAFEDCANLSALDAPASLREIGVTALKGTPAQLSWASKSEGTGAGESEKEIIDIPADGELQSVAGASDVPIKGENAIEPGESSLKDLRIQDGGTEQIVSKGEQVDEESGITPYMSTSNKLMLRVSDWSLAPQCSASGAEVGMNIVNSVDEYGPIINIFVGSKETKDGHFWEFRLNPGGTLGITSRSPSGGKIGSGIVLPPDGYFFGSVAVSDQDGLFTSSTPAYATAWLFRDEVHGNQELATQTWVSNNYASSSHNHDGAYAANDHTHDGRYYTETEIGDILESYVTNTALADKNYITKAVEDLENYYTKAEMDTSLAGKSDTGHKHAAADITSGTFGTARIADDAITTDKLADGAVTTDRIANLNVTEEKLAADAVTTAKIKNLNVTADKLAADAVTTDKIKDANVTTSKIKDLNVTTEKLANAAVTNDKIADGTIADDKLASTFVKPTEFGSVRCDNVYDADTNTYPTMYRRGGTPAVHEPHREGYEFLGWEWQRAGSSPASGSGDIAPAFAEAGEVTLRATWKEVIPEANHFFTTDVPLKAEDNAEYQSHVVAVRLADFERALRRVEFERNDATGILREGAQIELWVGNVPDVIGTGTRLALGETDFAWMNNLPLAQIGDESWGVYVGVRIRTADVDESRLIPSYASGAYVVSLVKMSYEFS